MQNACQEWALNNYQSDRNFRRFSDTSSYQASKVDVRNILGGDALAGEVFDTSGNDPTPTYFFSVSIYLDTSNIPHVYTSYPVTG